ncbi:MADS-box transcription factor 23-like [Pyrus ussuriensis x Pyrus communis]|uniref:MADS-box transcription factor 23-like n=1 Tax=Pyrus ussuriensis x Pyrus communis TaxID=2448454 RepID=A0A5N5GPS1_9ROSA|nr:MADS-box transcription factor 23-like [Pyrus ussuriensis x Pyrus communis]
MHNPISNIILIVLNNNLIHQENVELYKKVNLIHQENVELSKKPPQQQSYEPPARATNLGYTFFLKLHCPL